MKFSLFLKLLHLHSMLHKNKKTFSGVFMFAGECYTFTGDRFCAFCTFAGEVVLHLLACIRLLALHPTPRD